MKVYDVYFDGYYHLRWGRVKEHFKQIEDPWSVVKNQTQMLMKVLIEKHTDQEFRDQIKANAYQRDKRRLDYRNGSRYRDLQTSFGTIRNIKVPRGRKSGYQFSLFERYKRRHKEFDTAVLWASIGGLSQRKTRQMFKGILGNDLSEATISRILKDLDQHLKEYRNQPITSEYKYLFIDGFWIHILQGDVLVEQCVICAIAMTRDGQSEMLGFKLADSESEDSVRSLLQDLYRRGLKNIDLIIHDGSKAIQSASQWIYPYAGHQRCIFHKQMNVTQNIKNTKNKSLLLKDTKAVFKAPSKKQALRLAQKVKSNWQKKEPKAIRCFLQDLEQCLTYFEYPKTHWLSIRTTNQVELKIRHIRARIKSIGCFRNRFSAERYIFGLIKTIGHDLTDLNLHTFS